MCSGQGWRPTLFLVRRDVRLMSPQFFLTGEALSQGLLVTQLAHRFWEPRY